MRNLDYDKVRAGLLNSFEVVFDPHGFGGFEPSASGFSVPEAKITETLKYSEVMREDGWLHQSNQVRFNLIQYVPNMDREVARQMTVSVALTGKKRPAGETGTTGDPAPIGHFLLRMKTTRWHTRTWSKGVKMDLRLHGWSWRNMASGRVFGHMTVDDTATYENYFSVNRDELENPGTVRATIHGEVLYR